MTLYWFVSPLKNTGLNLAYEEYLLLYKEKKPQDAFLFFYENYPGIVLGQSLVLEKEVYLNKKNPPIYRRLSGGGSVCHFLGNLNYAFFINYEEYPEFFAIRNSYEKILLSISQEIPPLKIAGISDLCLTTKFGLSKISGSSQARKRGWLLHHGTFLYQKNFINYIRYYLKEPEKQPDYRKKRPHHLFISPVLPIKSRAQLINRITKAFQKSLQANLHKQSLTAKEIIKNIRLHQIKVPQTIYAPIPKSPCSGR